MTTGETLPPEPGPDASVDDIQADIEATRKQLGETVEALAAKADVKARAKQKAAETKERVTETVDHGRHAALTNAHRVRAAASDALTDDTGSVKSVVPTAVLIVTGALVIGIVIWRRRR